MPRLPRRFWLKKARHSPGKARTAWTLLSHEERSKLLHDAAAAVTLGELLRSEASVRAALTRWRQQQELGVVFTEGSSSMVIKNDGLRLGSALSSEYSTFQPR
jgi:hypothetical protein